MANKINQKKGNTFVFLEILSREGGIQSYVRDIFQAYQDLTNSTNASDSVLDTNILLLRDGLECENPYQSKSINFYYLKTQPIWLGRFRLAATLLWCLLTKKPQQVFCGHINLAPLVQILCVPLGIPYIVFTYGKEVWEPLPNKYQEHLFSPQDMGSISRECHEKIDPTFISRKSGPSPHFRVTYHCITVISILEASN